jgi:hydrogenase maturation protease
MPSREIRVLGLGNVLMGDDALGPWVVEELLAGWEFPRNVSVVDVGTPGLDLTPYLAHADTILLVDTVHSDGPPGTIKIYTLEQLLARPPQPRTSPHDPGLTEALFALAFEGSGPKGVILVGVVPGPVGKGIGLSPAVRAAVRPAAEKIVEFLTLFGAAPRPRASGLQAAPWWEAQTSARVSIG